MSDWEGSSDESTKAASPPPKVSAAVKKPVKSKWQDEDKEEDEPVSDWEASSSDSEEEESKPTTATAPKKKGTLKAKLAEKEAAKAARRAAGESEVYDEDEVLDPREKAKRDKERELNADLSNAVDLFGASALGGSSSKELDNILSFQPRTKEDFAKLSSLIMETVIQRHQTKPLYASFVETFARQLAEPLKDVEVRKVASGLTTLANEKQKEARDKASGKKKPKVGGKPILGATKVSTKYDTSAYEEALDDFGTTNEDFM